MKIVHYLARFDLGEGGVVRAVLDLSSLLTQHGHEVVLVSHDDADVPEAWRAGTDGMPTSVRLDRPDKAMGRFGPRSLERFDEILAGADVVHLHTPWDPVNPQLAGVATRRGLPYVLSIHGMLDDWCMAQRGLKKRLYLKLAGRRLLEGAAFVHCTASAEHEQASKWYPRGSGRVIPLVFDTEPYDALPGPDLARAAFDIEPARPLLLFLSRVHYKKGPDLLVDVVVELHRRGGNARLIMAGTGDEAYVQQIQAQVEAAGLGDHVTLPGLVTGEQKTSLYEAADVFVLPTSQENFGIVFPEALACRTPVVTTRGVDIWPELEASGGGVIVDRTVQAFADAVEVLLGDDARRDAMGDAGRRWVLEELSGDAVVEAYLALYREAAAS
jgi:glycosyltransferase involved in cell wall biosynthesis